MSEPITRGTVCDALAPHLEAGESLLAWGSATSGRKTLLVGMTDRRILLSERKTGGEEKDFEALAIQDVAQVRVTRGQPGGLLDGLVSRLFVRNLVLRTHGGRQMTLAFQNAAGLRGNRNVPDEMLANLADRAPNLGR